MGEKNQSTEKQGKNRNIMGEKIKVQKNSKKIGIKWVKNPKSRKIGIKQV